MKDFSKHTLASIVTGDHRVVPVLEKYNLDYCCRGKTTLADACSEKKLQLDHIESELEYVMQGFREKSMPFNEMSAEHLVNHILVRHHYYVKQAMPLIYMHLEKVSKKHGDFFPYMNTVFSLFGELQDEMNLHMQKEEMVLFPMIIDLERKYKQKNLSGIVKNDISGSVSVLESEHQQAGDILYQIRELTNQYSIPQGTCTTFKITLNELKEFEDDLHEHVHLENNILFPKALQFV